MMRSIVGKFAVLSGWLALAVAAPAQIGNRPPHSGPALPSTCIPGDMFTLTTAPAGANIYSCVATNTWAVEGVSSGGGNGTLAIQNNGTTVGTRGTANFIPGAGIINLITDTGSAIDIQQTADTAVLLSQVTNQAGTPLLCASASGSGTTYTCALTPTLTTYTTGMVLYWKIDTSSITASPTLNVDTLGAKNVVDYQGNALTVGVLVGGSEVPISYDGTNMRCMTCGLVASGGTVGSFNSISSGTNTTAAMTVGSGATLSPAGTGVVNANQASGVSYPAGPSVHTVPVITASNTATYKTVPDCQDSGGNHINYTQSTDTFSCGSSGGGGGSDTASISLPIGGVYSPDTSYAISLWITAGAYPTFSNMAGIGTVMTMPGAYCAYPSYCSAFTRFWWPQDFNSSDAVNVVIRTMPATSGGSGTIVYSAQFACPADGTNLTSPTYNAMSSTTLTVSGTANAGQTVIIPNVPITGCSAGTEAYLNIYRDGSGTPGSSVTDYLTSVRVDYSTQ
jgi:hypothetical protein